MIDPVAWSETAEWYIAENGAETSWGVRRNQAYKKVDEIVEYILARVNEINPPKSKNDCIACAGAGWRFGYECETCDGVGVC